MPHNDVIMAIVWHRNGGGSGCRSRGFSAWRFSLFTMAKTAGPKALLCF